MRPLLCRYRPSIEIFSTLECVAIDVEINSEVREKKSRRKFKSYQKNEINFPVLCRCIQLQSIAVSVECGVDSAKPDLETAIGKTSLMYISDDGNSGDNNGGYHFAIRLKRNEI